MVLKLVVYSFTVEAEACNDDHKLCSKASLSSCSSGWCFDEIEKEREMQFVSQPEILESLEENAVTDS